jgi:hypothetical protein
LPREHRYFFELLFITCGAVKCFDVNNVNTYSSRNPIIVPAIPGERSFKSGMVRMSQ